MQGTLPVRIIFIDNQNYNNGIQLNQINGPKSDLPVTFIFSALKTSKF